jgi:hypothetical protein
MKILTVLLGVIGCGVVSGFADTAKVFIDQRLVQQHEKLTEQVYISDEVNEYLITGMKNGNKRGVLYRIPENLLINSSESSQFDVINVYYNSIDKVDFDYSNIDVGYYDKLDSRLNHDQQLAVYDLQDRQYSLSELKSDDRYVIIQMVPSIQETNHDYELLDDDDDDDDDLDTSSPQSFISAKKDKQIQKSLFTEYQFFTPGIWSCILISFFLLAILYNALIWVSSIEISYGAFEKQVDYEKKNE